MKNTLVELISFLKYPYQPETYTSIKPKIFFALLLLTLAIIIPYALILEAVGVDKFDNILEQMLKDKNGWLSFWQFS